MPSESLYKNEKSEWLDFENPSRDDLETLHRDFGIDHLLLDDVMDPNHLPKYEVDEKLEFFLLRESVDSKNHAHHTISYVSSSLGVFLVDSKLITVHQSKSNCIRNVREQLEAPGKTYRAQEILLKLAVDVIKSFDGKSQELFELINKKEDQIFLRKADRAIQLRELYKLKRKIGLSVRILNNFSQWIEKFSNLDLSTTKATDLHDKYVDVMADFEHLQSQITSLISLFLAIADQKANYVMKVLAIYSMYFLPLSFIVGLYGMNFKHMPELNSPYGYIGVLTAMAILVGITYIYVKRRKW